MIQVQRIEKTDPLYEQELDLRKRIILDPIRCSIDDFHRGFPGYEDRFEHFVAVIDHPKGARVVGSVCLIQDQGNPASGRLMQLAVDPQRQREGIGRKLLAELERRALGELGITSLYAHVPVYSTGFFEKMGWRTTGKAFTEANVKHYKMVFAV